MRTLIIVWFGQLVSTFGTRMSSFAIHIWAWEITGQATAIALVGVSTQIPRLLIRACSQSRNQSRILATTHMAR